jgi:inactivated superfamily I helicase
VQHKKENTMITQINDQIKKTIDQIQDNARNPEKFFNSIQEKNTVLAKEVQELISQAPQETFKYFQEQQEKFHDLSQNLHSALNHYPVDWQTVGQLWLQYHTEQLNSHLDKAKSHGEKLQHLINDYVTPVATHATGTHTASNKKTKASA